MTKKVTKDFDGFEDLYGWEEAIMWLIEDMELPREFQGILRFTIEYIAEIEWDIYQYCRKLLEYIDLTGEIVHERGCLPRLQSSGNCTCGLEYTIKAIRKEVDDEAVHR